MPRLIAVAMIIGLLAACGARDKDSSFTSWQDRCKTEGLIFPATPIIGTEYSVAPQVSDDGGETWHNCTELLVTPVAF